MCYGWKSHQHHKNQNLMVASTGKENKSVGRMATTRYVLGFQYYTFHCSLSSLSSHKTPVSNLCRYHRARWLDGKGSIQA